MYIDSCRLSLDSIYPNSTDTVRFSYDLYKMHPIPQHLPVWVKDGRIWWVQCRLHVLPLSLYANPTTHQISHNAPFCNKCAHNALNKYSTMHHFVTEMCTFLFQNGALWGSCLMHCRICERGLSIMIIFLRQHPGATNCGSSDSDNIGGTPH